MLYALTAEQMRSAEEAAVASGSATLADLMSRAGSAVAADAAAGAPRGRIVIVTGKGNNGGDGWAAARELHAAGRDVLVVALADPAESRPPAADAASAALAAGVPWLAPASDAEMLRALDGAALVVDAIFGFGFSGQIREPYARAIEAIDDCDAPVLSVDVPSGVDSDTGAVGGLAVRADVTLTFSAPKVGIVQYPGAEYAGEVRVADLGLPRELIDEAGEIELLDAEDHLELFPFPRPDDHKGSRGRVLVVAGSLGMTGAPALASAAALRTGAGYVKLACPATVLPTLAAKLTSVVLAPLLDAAPGVLVAEAADEVLRLAEGYDAVVLGPGLTAGSGPAAVVERLVRELPLPLVADADALNALAAGNAGLLSQRSAPTVLTPHPGEAARLLGVSTGDVQADRVAAARRLAEGGATCVLKGARSVIAGEGRCAINTSGNAGMATAGTGDVLAGLIGTLLAQGLSPFEAAVLGTYLHGRAGDHAALALTETCLTAEDLIAHLPDAVAELLGW